MKNSENTQSNGPPEPENQTQKEFWKTLLDCGFTPNEIANPPDEETEDTIDDDSELTIPDKIRKIFSALTQEEVESVRDVLLAEPSSLFEAISKTKNNAKLALLLVANMWFQDKDRAGFGGEAIGND